MRTLALGPWRRAAGTVRLPGSKSISNRALLLAALAEGPTELGGVLQAKDTRVMIEALAALGVAIERRDPDRVLVHGSGGRLRDRAELFLANAGTAYRPLAAILALSGGQYRLYGSVRMHERPIGDLVAALRAIGARIEYLGRDGFPPLAIRPGSVDLSRPLRLRAELSSQFLSALLMALPPAGGGRIEVDGELVSKPYVEMTLALMRRFGVAVVREGWRSFEVPGSAYRSPGTLAVEADASAASYFLAAGAIGGGPVRVEGVGCRSIQGDVRFAEVLQAMGAHVAMGEDWIEACGVPPLAAFDLDLNHIPDAAMTAAVLALFARGTSAVRNIANWRVKETDRLAAMARELRKFGAAVEEGAASLRIRAPAALAPAVAVDTYDDHRIAMCFSLVALGGVPVTIRDPDCVAKTFPEYFRAFAGICRG